MPAADNLASSSSPHGGNHGGSSPLQTTLYDLISTIQDVTEAGEEWLIVPTVVSILRTQRVRWLGVTTESEGQETTPG